MFIAVTGRENQLARAELEAVFNNITVLSDSLVTIDVPNISLARLEHIGFSKKIAKIVKNSIPKDQLAQVVAASIRDNAQATGKLSFGISWLCDAPINKKNYLGLAKKIKQSIQDQGQSARFIQPKNGFELNSAQIQYNQLLHKGCEVIIFGKAESLSIAITQWTFNPSSYSSRDYDRPARSAKVGMFPPKLAQVLINLSQAKANDVVCDPFCGSGVVLQEALYVGHNVMGSDSSEEMVVAAEQNLQWFCKKINTKNSFNISRNDARKFRPPASSYVIVSEGYLGPGLSEKPTLALLEPIKTNLEKLYIGFLSHVSMLENRPSAVVITLPFWQTTTGINYLKVIDQITDLGYTIRQFNSVNTTQLFYKRSQQIVGRQVLVLELKKSK